MTTNRQVQRSAIDLHFALGGLIALAHVHAHGNDTIGQEIRSAFGDEALLAAAAFSGADQDRETLRWLGVTARSAIRTATTGE